MPRARKRVLLAGIPAAAAVAVAVVLVTSGGGRPPRTTGWRQVLPSGSARIAEGPDGGSVWSVEIHNSFVSTSRRSYVYLPRYRPHVRFPAAYLLHGFPGSPFTFIRASRIAYVADHLIEARELRPLIVVMPVAGRTLHYDGEWAGPWEKFVVDDVVPWTDAHLPTIAAARGRAIGGLSAGGFGAVDIALRHLGLFSTAEAWAGYFHPLQDGPFRHAKRSELLASDPTLLAERFAPTLKRQRVRIFLAAGIQDPVDVRRAQDFSAELTRLGVDHVVVLRPGAHHESFWRRILAPGLEYTFPGPG